MYGFEFSRTQEGLMRFQHNQFDRRNDEGLQIKQNTNNSVLTQDQELYLIKLQLEDIQRNQQIMQIQIRKIIEKQKETQQNIKKAMIDYVKIRVDGQTRGEKVKKFVWKFHFNITNSKYKKFLYKRQKQLNLCQENLFTDDIIYQKFKQYFYTYPLTNHSIFDIKIPNLNLRSPQMLELCNGQEQNESNDQWDVQSVSNISNYFDL